MSVSLSTDKVVNKPTGGSTTWSAISGKPSVFAPDTHSHAISDITGLSVALDGKQAAGSYAASSHTHAATDITEDSTHRFATDTEKSTWNGKQDALTNGYGLSGTTTKAVALTTSQAFATAETTISAATYADITGASISLAAGTWLILATVNGASQTTTVAVMMCAITDGSNAVIAEGSQHLVAGTATVRTWGNVSLSAIVSPTGTTTYKLRGARGTTTQTGNWIASDGNGVNTANNVSNNSDKGTSIRAVRIG